MSIALVYLLTLNQKALVTLSNVPPEYKGGVLGIFAIALIISGSQTIITNITFTITGRLMTSKLTGLNINPIVRNMALVILIIKNIPASLNNNIVSCTAELNTAVLL